MDMFIVVEKNGAKVLDQMLAGDRTPHLNVGTFPGMDTESTKKQDPREHAGTFWGQLRTQIASAWTGT